MFWNMMAGYYLFGVNELGARFFSAVCGVGAALAAFHLGRILCNVRVGLWTGLISATTIIFTISARAATVDSALTFLTVLTFLFFVAARRGVKGVGARDQGMGAGISEISISNLKSSILRPPPSALRPFPIPNP
jgi:4-amino-4-deoxy-L-arabinose transferase-like glycosyltransferase